MTYTEKRIEKTIQIWNCKINVTICKEYDKSADEGVWRVYWIERYGSYNILMVRKNRPRPSEIKKVLEKYL